MASNFKQSPTRLRNVAKELYRQGTEPAQINFTKSGWDGCGQWLNDQRSRNTDWEWPIFSTDEKSMLCLFFAEYLEGEK